MSLDAGATSRAGARRTLARAIPPWIVDAALAVGVAGVVALVISANQGGRQQADLVAYLWAVGLGALMFARRRWPRIVLAVTVLGLFAYYAAGYPAVGVAVPVAAAVFSAAQMGRLWSAIAAIAVVTVVSVGFRLIEGQPFEMVVSYELAGHVLLLGAAAALGDSLRARRELAVSARRLVESVAEQERQRARSDAHEARVAIARDLHDSVGHAVTVISLHSDVASEAIGRDDDAAREAVRTVKSTSRSVLSELRDTVRRLRAPEPDRDGPRLLRDIGPQLLRDFPIPVEARIPFADADAETEVDGDADAQPEVAADARREPGTRLPAVAPEVQDAAFRIVQEALTNVVKHAAATHVLVDITTSGRELRVRVVDDGGGASAAPATGADTEPGAEPAPPAGDAARPVRRGLGIVGMRERAAAVGGTLDAGPIAARDRRPGGREVAPGDARGFAVCAVLPLEGRT